MDPIEPDRISGARSKPLRRLLLQAGASLLLPGVAGCARRFEAAPAWQARLRGDTVALLGEVHDNPEQHRLRAAALRRACDAGWRPAIVMEQFDLDRQADLERSRRAAPRDTARLIAAAAPAKSGWQWPLYEPLLALALEFDLPLRAGNLSRADAARIVREGDEAVLGRRRLHELGLDSAVAADWQAAQERAIDAGHCGALPPTLLPAMARAQFARDAVMAQVLRENATYGGVLIAGNGHVRRDIGVPRWLAGLRPGRVLSVGYVESGDAVSADRFDAVVVTAAAERADACASLQR